MIKLKDLLTLREMKYTNVIKPRHQKKMVKEAPNFSVMVFPQQLPPENDSKTTLKELKYITNLEEGDRESIELYDDIPKAFGELLNQNGINEEQYIELIESVVKQSSRDILYLKYKYNRPRPYQIAEFYGVNLNGTKLDSMNTPSYPSGHAVQGYLVGWVLKSYLPTMSNQIDQLSEAIAQSRLSAKAHFPSDKHYGKKIAGIMYRAFKHD